MPKLLDLCCGYGGASVGYARAGFEVVGCDITPCPGYPFKYVVRDALLLAADVDYLAQFDVIAASPPCQEHTQTKYLRRVQGNKVKKGHEDILDPLRSLLERSGKPYVIENVPGAPLYEDATVQVCGTAFGLQVIDGAGRTRQLWRHRWFESNVQLVGTPCKHVGQPLGVYGDRNHRLQRGGTTCSTVAQAQELMGIDWIKYWDDIKEAVPPAYTEYIGKQLISALHLEVE